MISMKKTKIFNRKIKNSEDGVAGVVVAILMIGLIITALGFIQGIYIPQWMEQKEAEHMEEIQNQFSQLKFAIDTLSLAEKEYSTISTPITLGSKEMPFLTSTRSYGSLKVNQEDCEIIITANGNVEYPFVLGALTYTSDNAYLIEQSLSYETGGVILSQEDGDIITIQPSVYMNEQQALSFEMIRLIGISGKTTASGYGTYPVQTRYSDSNTQRIGNVKKITINNTHPNAWEKFFDNLFKNYDDINCTIENNNVVIKPESDSVDATIPDVSIHLTDIKIQISPGWVE